MSKMLCFLNIFPLKIPNELILLVQSKSVTSNLKPLSNRAKKLGNKHPYQRSVGKTNDNTENSKNSKIVLSGYYQGKRPQNNGHNKSATNLGWKGAERNATMTSFH